MYRSLAAQSIHYFGRPHTSVLTTPHRGRAAWRGSDLGDPSSWRIALRAEQIEELERALAVARATGRAAANLRRRDFPLPSLAKDLAGWRAELERGRGFVVVSGVPVQRWGQATSELFFWCLGHHLGVPGAQNTEGDLLGHVVDTGASADDRTVRRYRTSANIAYHCDAADAVGLLCLRKAKSGGLSRLVSSVSVYNEVLTRRADLVPRLYEPFHLDAHGQSGLDHFPVVPCRHVAGRLRTFYHSDYFRSALRYSDVAPLTRDESDLLDLYEEIACSPELYLDMELEPGDIQLVSNHTVLHARTDYEDHDAPEEKRHLLRLWLSFERPESRAERLLAATARIGVLLRFARAKVRRAVRGAARRA